MGAGFMVRNNSDNLVIDSKFKNLAFARKFTAITTQQSERYSCATINLSDLSGYPLVATQSAAGAWATTHHYANGAAFVDIVSRGPVGSAVDCFIFAGPVDPGERCGIQVFNDGGALVFSSGCKYMRVVGSLFDMAGPPLPTGSLTLPAGKSYAVFQTEPMAYRDNTYTPGAPNDRYVASRRGCFAVNGNVIKTVADAFWIMAHGTSPYPDYNKGATGFVIDVTGY
jgi:hypothetical protein